MPAVIAGFAWQGAAVAAPLFIKQAIDRGVVHGDRTALYAWCGAILGVGLVEAVGGAVRHYFAIRTAPAATRTSATSSSSTRSSSTSPTTTASAPAT